MWFSLRECFSSVGRLKVFVDLKSINQGIGKELDFVGEDEKFLLPPGLKHLFPAVVESCPRGDMGKIRTLKLFEEAGTVCLGNPLLDERSDSRSYILGYGLEGELFKRAAFEGRIEGPGDIVLGVGKGAVEVDDDYLKSFHDL